MNSKIHNLNAKNSSVRKFIERHISEVDLDVYEIVYARTTKVNHINTYDVIIIRKRDTTESIDRVMVLYHKDWVITGTIGWTIASAWRNCSTFEGLENKFPSTVNYTSNMTRQDRGVIKHIRRNLTRGKYA